MAALLGGMLAGVASYAARMHVTPGSAATLWLRGAEIGLFVAGVEALWSAC